MFFFYLLVALLTWWRVSILNKTKVLNVNWMYVKGITQKQNLLPPSTLLQEFPRGFHKFSPDRPKTYNSPTHEHCQSKNGQIDKVHSCALLAGKFFGPVVNVEVAVVQFGHYPKLLHCPEQIRIAWYYLTTSWPIRREWAQREGGLKENRTKMNHYRQKMKI